MSVPGGASGCRLLCVGRASGQFHAKVFSIRLLICNRFCLKNSPDPALAADRPIEPSTPTKQQTDTWTDDVCRVRFARVCVLSGEVEI